MTEGEKLKKKKNNIGWRKKQNTFTILSPSSFRLDHMKGLVTKYYLWIM